MLTEESHRLARWQLMATQISVGGRLPITFKMVILSTVYAIEATMRSIPIVDDPRHGDQNPYNDTADVRQRREILKGAEPERSFFLVMALTLYDHECREWIHHDGDRFANPHRLKELP